MKKRLGLLLLLIFILQIFSTTSYLSTVNLKVAKELYTKGLVVFLEKDYEKALSYFEEAVKKNPHYAEAYCQIGYCHSQLSHYEEAIESFKQAILLNPDYTVAHYGLGWIYSQLGCYQQAIESFRQAINFKPIFADAHYNLGVAYFKLGDKGSALEEYKILRDMDQDLTNKLFDFIY